LACFVYIIGFKSLMGSFLTSKQVPLPYLIVNMKILMVCLGNICRSPLAQGILQHKANALGLPITVHSASTNSYHTGQPPHPFSIKVAMQNGIDISNQRARRFTPNDVEIYDAIYAMAHDVILDMHKIAKHNWDYGKIKLISSFTNKADVPDPYYGGQDGFLEVYNILDNLCNNIIDNYLNATK
jgi:protein-tyrosine phosphatase